MREHHLIICVLVLTIGLATFPLTARADKLEGLDNTMQVLDDLEISTKRLPICGSPMTPMATRTARGMSPRPPTTPASTMISSTTSSSRRT